MQSESEVAQLCPALCNPMDCTLPGTSVHGIFQARVLELGVIAFSGVISYHLKKTLPAVAGFEDGEEGHAPSSTSPESLDKGNKNGFFPRASS